MAEIKNYGTCDFEECKYCVNDACTYAPERCYIDEQGDKHGD